MRSGSSEFDKILTIEKAVHNKNYPEKDLFEKEVPAALLDSLVTSGECGDQGMAQEQTEA